MRRGPWNPGLDEAVTIQPVEVGSDAKYVEGHDELRWLTLCSPRWKAASFELVVVAKSRKTCCLFSFSKRFNAASVWLEIGCPFPAFEGSDQGIDERGW